MLDKIVRGVRCGIDVCDMEDGRLFTVVNQCQVKLSEAQSSFPSRGSYDLNVARRSRHSCRQPHFYIWLGSIAESEDIRP